MYTMAITPYSVSLRSHNAPNYLKCIEKLNLKKGGTNGSNEYAWKLDKSKYLNHPKLFKKN